MLDTMPTLDYSQTYSCPLCLRGEIRAFPLMDAFGCDFCRHIFSANLEEQILDLADGQVPRRWYRRGHQWITKDQEVFWGYGVIWFDFNHFTDGDRWFGSLLFSTLAE